MTDGTRELIIGVIGIVSGWLGSVIKGAFTAGSLKEQMATKKDLDNYVTVATFTDFKVDVKSDLDDIKRSQEAADQRAEKRHAQIIEALLRGRE